MKLCHRRHRGPILMFHRLAGATPLASIPQYPSLEANLLTHLDINLCVEQFPKFGPVESQQSLKNDHFSRTEQSCLGHASVSRKVVARKLDRKSLAQPAHMS